jgi:hypothetical protein
MWKTRSHRENTESDVIKIWKTRSHMGNTESDVREKYGKHGIIWKTRSHMENTESAVKYGKHGVRRIVNVKYGKQ